MATSPFVLGLFNPDFNTEIPNLNNYIEAIEEQVTETEVKAERKIQSLNNTSAPLTKAEADYIDEKIEKMLNSIKDTRSRLANIQFKIDTLVAESNNVNFDFDISKKKNLKKAIQKSFGAKSKVIDYKMYKAALAAKKALEAAEVDAYSGTNPNLSLTQVAGTASGGGSRITNVAGTASGGGSRIVGVAGTASGGGSRITQIDSGSTSTTQI